MYQQKNKLILASASPRRAELLSSCGVAFLKDSADIDETPLPTESPREMVERLAKAKAKAVSSRHPNAVVLGADTTVVVDGEILGKPYDEEEAKRFLTKLQGRQHQVWGGFSLIAEGRGIEITESHESLVTMIALAESEIDRYVQTGEPLDKAGAYAIQGVGASLIASVNGSYTNVVGLNLSATMIALRKLGVV